MWSGVVCGLVCTCIRCVGIRCISNCVTVLYVSYSTCSEFVKKSMFVTGSAVQDRMSTCVLCMDCL